MNSRIYLKEPISALAPLGPLITWAHVLESVFYNWLKKSRMKHSQNSIEVSICPLKLIIIESCIIIIPLDFIVSQFVQWFTIFPPSCNGIFRKSKTHLSRDVQIRRDFKIASHFLISYTRI